MLWSVRGILNFSYGPGINEAFEGSWETGDQQIEDGETMDLTLGFEMLTDASMDENNNIAEA